MPTGTPVGSDPIAVKEAGMGDETKVQIREVKKGMEAMGSVAERYLIRWLGPVGRKIAEATQTGRIMALVGVIAAAVGLVLIAANALSFRTEMLKGVLVVSKPVANIRDKASIKGKVVAKAEQGETLSYITASEGWYKVSAKEGTGWVSHDMVERKGHRTAIIEYEMKGYGIVFLAGLGLFIIGIVQKKKNR
jgi:uncharacterized protein YgiM (DUF1202 family)